MKIKFFRIVQLFQKLQISQKYNFFQVSTKLKTLKNLKLWYKNSSNTRFGQPDVKQHFLEYILQFLLH